MIKTETVTIGGVEFQRTYSDAGMLIECDGRLYEEAVDVIPCAFEYTETETPITPTDYEQLGRIVFGAENEGEQ